MAEGVVGAVLDSSAATGACERRRGITAHINTRAIRKNMDATLWIVEATEQGAINEGVRIFV
jgi:hypothetical protein